MPDEQRARNDLPQRGEIDPGLAHQTHHHESSARGTHRTDRREHLREISDLFFASRGIVELTIVVQQASRENYRLVSSSDGGMVATLRGGIVGRTVSTRDAIL